ncbi:MAG: rRNA cytosine-C5-methylase [Rikenellaceae bacterium]
MENNLPEQFVKNLLEVMPQSEIEEFKSAISRESIVSLRTNPYKNIIKEGDKVAWCETGTYLDERAQFTLDPNLHGGGYYVQEASSMFLEQLFKQVILKELGDEIAVLDLCAAPGGKSTHISSLVGLKSLVVANETISSRSKILEENIIKWGLGNVIVTSSDPKQFGNLTHSFDVLSIDAPCSGEGMFRRVNDAVNQWSASNVELCVQRQRRIISDSFNSLKEGGFLIYSTCTFNKKENEENLAWVSENFDVEPIDISIEDSWGVVKTITDGINGFRFYPHKCKGEGMFISIMRKKECGESSRIVQRKNYKSRYVVAVSKEQKELATWIKDSESFTYIKNEKGIVKMFNKNYIELFKNLEQYVKIIYEGVELGQFFKSDFKPSHPLALYVGANFEKNVPIVYVPKEMALDFIRKKDIDCSIFEIGINLVSYENLPLGFIKRIGNRCNNLYPKEFRIVNL